MKRQSVLIMLKNRLFDAQKTGRRTSVIMEKHLESGSHTVAMISYKQSKNEAPGEWIFFGLAPC